MIFAVPSDFDKVKSIFYTHKKWFPHVRTDYMKRMIAKQQLILEDGILITFHHFTVYRRIQIKIHTEHKIFYS